MKLFGLLKKYKKMLLLLVLLIGLYYYFTNIREGFVKATSCTQFTNCSECVNGKVTDSSSPCYWSNDKKKCGSFDDPGYSRTCGLTTDTTTPIKDAIKNKLNT